MELPIVKQLVPSGKPARGNLFLPLEGSEHFARELGRATNKPSFHEAALESLWLGSKAHYTGSR